VLICGYKFIERIKNMNFKQIAGVMLVFSSVLSFTTFGNAITEKPKESYSDTSTLTRNGIMQEALDTVYATRFNAINKLVLSAGNTKDVYQRDTVKLKEGAELYEKLIADYPDKVMTLEVRRILQDTYQKLYNATTDDTYRIKLIETAQINMLGIEKHMNVYGQSDFFNFSYADSLNAIIKNGGKVDKQDISKMKQFHQAKLADNISDNLKSYHRQALAAIYIEQNEINSAMKYINQGLNDAIKSNNTSSQDGYLFLAVWAMGKSNNAVKKDEYYQQLIKDNNKIKDIIDRRINLLLNNKDNR
jgi:hypothetical protein